MVPDGLAHTVIKRWFINKNKNMNSRRSFIRKAGVIAGGSILATALHQQAFATLAEKWRPVIVST